MVRLEENKLHSEHKKIERIPVPPKVYIPLLQHLGKPCNPIVNIGDSVLRGQKIGTAEANVFAPVHSSVSGRVIAIESCPHPVSGRGKAVVIEPNTEAPAQAVNQMAQAKADNLTADEIRRIVFEAGIVGMGGASFPAHIKLNPPKPVDTLIINGAECEPYLTADYRLMLEKAKEIVKGIELVARCLQVKKVYVAIEDNKPEAIKAFDCELRSTNYDLRVLKSAYPQGGEKQLIKSILKREVPRGKLPFDIGAVVHNVATVFAIYEAVYLNKPLYERVVTVTGSCLKEPKNLLVPLGTPARELIAYCGGCAEAPAKIIFGGPMMGIAQYTDEVPVIKSTNGILLLTQDETKTGQEEYCIRCGACVRDCPCGLMPCLINLASEKGLWNEAAAHGAADCMECGTCSYVCPANRRLVQSIKRAKLEAGR
jgi:electron transport complex protein RnfC